MNANDTTYFFATVRAFSGETAPRQRKVSVDADGVVRVYDSVADHYTTVHSLSAGQCARLRRIAREQ